MSETKVNITQLGFEKSYLDGSGVEYAVRFDSTATASNGDQGIIEFEHIDKVQFPATDIEWLIGCLVHIRDSM